MNKPTCSAPHCSRVLYARSLCEMHYARWRRGNYSGPAPLAQFPAPEEAFEARTELQGGCLIWTGSKDSHGYGQLQVFGKLMPAHRYAWTVKHGPIPDAKVVDHYLHCDPACVTADHLRLATHAANIAHRRSAQSNNKGSGIRNVYKYQNRWRVQIVKNGTVHSYGTHETIEEAARVAELARKELFGAYAGHN